MRQSILVEGKSPQEFVDAYNETLSELSRFTILRENQLSDTSVLIFYECPDELDEKVDSVSGPLDYTIEMEDPEERETVEILIKIVAPVPKNRRCCECPHYNWGKGCPFSDDRVKHMSDACKMFHVNIEEV